MTIVTLLAVLLAVAAGPVYDVIQKRIEVAEALDPARWGLELVVGLLFALVGVTPTLVSVSTGRSWGIGVAVVVTIAAIVVIAVAQLPDLVARNDGTPEAYNSLGVGDCFEGSVEVEGVIQESQTPRLVPCDQPHFGEVVHVGYTDGREGDSAYPGGEWLSLEAQIQCEAPFGNYVGRPMTESSLMRWVAFPNEDSWARGVRPLVCAVYSPDALTTGSLKGSGL